MCLCDKLVCSVRKNPNTKAYASPRPPMAGVTRPRSATKYLRQQLPYAPLLCITHDIITTMDSVSVDFIYFSYFQQEGFAEDDNVQTGAGFVSPGEMYDLEQDEQEACRPVRSRLS